MSTDASAVAYDGAMAATLVQDPFNSELTVQDRCDRCGAQAYVRARGATWPSDVLFCAHHGREHIPALQADPTVDVHDESQRLIDETALMKQATTEV